MTDLNALESLYFAALEKRPAERPAFLDVACGGDADLRARVERLLAAQPNVGGFLDAPVATADLPSDVRTATFGTDSPAATADFPGKDEHVGATLGGKYKLIEAIGEGGMGSVYMAQQTEPVKRAVAVKVIKAGMDSKAVLARFEAERQALAMMDHPNIARVLDAGTTESGRPYFVMELVKGVPITQYCDERKLTPKQRLELFVPVCHAIQHAHQKGVIHRDIKPSNVLVALYDDRPVSKVIDFGVAKAAGQTLTDKTLMTGFGAVVGTPEYMSPEQASLNNLDIDTRSDVYSLGVLLYELLTGSTPVDRKSLGKAALLEILRIVREVEAPKPSHKLSTSDALPSVAANRATEPAKLSRLMKGELDWVLLKALEKDRTRRYDTANGLARDIQRYLADEVVEARPPSAGYRLKKFVKRHKGQVIAASLVVLALVAGVAGTTVGLLEAKAQQGLAERAAEREKDRAEGERVAKEDAEAKRAEAVAEKKRAEDEADRATHLAATNALVLAQTAANEDDTGGATDWLESVPTRHRGWAWNYLRRKFDGGLFALHGHTDPVRSVAYSPQGDRIVTASLDGTVRVWDARTGMELLVFRGHERGGLVAGFSPDGRLVASCGFSPDEFKVWNASTGEVVAAVQNQNVRSTFAFTPDGKRFLCISGNRTAVVNLTTGEPTTYHDGQFLGYEPTRGLVFSALVGQKRAVQVWNLESGAQVGTIADGFMPGERLVISPDGARVLTVNWKQTVPKRPGPGERPALSNRISILTSWNCPDLKVIGTPETVDGTVTELAFSPDGARLATVTWDEPMAGFSNNRTLRVRNVSDGQQVFSADVTDSAGKLIFSPDGQRLAIQGGTRVRAWETRSWSASPPYPVTGGQYPLSNRLNVASDTIAYSPDGRHLLSCNDRTVRVWAADGGLSILRSGPADCDLAGLAVSPDGRLVAAVAIAGRRRGVHVFDADTGRLVKTVPGEGDGVSFRPPGDRLIVTAATVVNQKPELKAVIYDTRTWAEIETIPDCMSCAYSPDGKWLATAPFTGFDQSSDSAVTIRDARTGAVHRVLPLYRTDSMLSLTFSADGTRLMAMNVLAAAAVWDVGTGTRLATVEARGDETPLSGDLSRDGRLVAIRTASQVRVFRADTGELLTRVPTLQVPAAPGNYVQFTPDGKAVVTFSEVSAAPLQVWDIRTGSRLLTIPNAHKGAMRRAVFSGDGTRLVTDGIDGTIVVHDIRPSTPSRVIARKRDDGEGTPRLSEFGGDRNFSYPAFAPCPDQQHFAVELADRTVRIWSTVTGTERVRLEGHTDAVAQVKYDPNGERLATFSRDGTVRLWDPRAGRTLFTFRGVVATPRCGLVFSPDGTALIASGGGENPVLMWDTATGKEILRVPHPQSCQGVHFAPDARSLVMYFGESLQRQYLELKNGTWVTAKNPGSMPVALPRLVTLAGRYLPMPVGSGANSRIVLIDREIPPAEEARRRAANGPDLAWHLTELAAALAAKDTHAIGFHARHLQALWAMLARWR